MQNHLTGSSLASVCAVTEAWWANNRAAAQQGLPSSQSPLERSKSMYVRTLAGGFHYFHGRFSIANMNDPTSFMDDSIYFHEKKGTLNSVEAREKVHGLRVKFGKH